MESDRILALLRDVWTEITPVLERPWETPATLSQYDPGTIAVLRILARREVPTG